MAATRVTGAAVVARAWEAACSWPDSTLNSGATLDLASTGAAGSGAISFNSMSGSANAQLVLEQSAQVTNGTFTNTLNDFGDHEALVLRGFAFSGTESYTVSNGVLTAQNAGGQSQSFTLANTNEPAKTTYFARSDGQGSTIISSDLVCYAQGTRIRTIGGEVAVEALRVGDCVVTGSGALRPIRWIGHRTVACRRHPHRGRTALSRSDTTGFPCVGRSDDGGSRLRERPTRPFSPGSECTFRTSSDRAGPGLSRR